MKVHMRDNLIEREKEMFTGPLDMERYGEFEQINGCIANRLQDEVLRLEQELEELRSKPTKVIANEVLREIVEQAHMDGQADAGVDPSYSNARSYCDGLFSST